MTGNAEQHGCVTYFQMGEQRVTVWRYPRPDGTARYSLLIDSVHVEPQSVDHGALFQAVAEELHRLGTMAGRLKRRLIDSGVPFHVVDAIGKKLPEAKP